MIQCEGRQSPWGRYRTHPNTKFLAQRIFILLEGQVGGGSGEMGGGQLQEQQQQLFLPEWVSKETKGESVLR